MTKKVHKSQDQRRAAKMKAVIQSKVEREDQRTIMPGETSSANTAIRPTFLIQLCTLIWSKSTQRDQMESLETHQQVEEAEEDQERTHTRDLIQGLKISSRHRREKEDQSTHLHVSMKSTPRFSHISHKLLQLN